jgi:hypothetical protein
MYFASGQSSVVNTSDYAEASAMIAGMAKLREYEGAARE